jgi:hypothetical protein
MRQGKCETSGLAERRRECEAQTECEWSADAHHRKKMGGVDPIGFLCDVLSK